MTCCFHGIQAEVVAVVGKSSPDIAWRVRAMDVPVTIWTHVQVVKLRATGSSMATLGWTVPSSTGLVSQISAIYVIDVFSWVVISNRWIFSRQPITILYGFGCTNLWPKFRANLFEPFWEVKKYIAPKETNKNVSLSLPSLPGFTTLKSRLQQSNSNLNSINLSNKTKLIPQ